MRIKNFYFLYGLEKKSVPAVVLLSLFLGITGIQKFYLGDVRAGVSSSIFAFTFIPFIFALLDAANMRKLAYDYYCFATEHIIDDIKYLRK